MNLRKPRRTGEVNCSLGLMGIYLLETLEKSDSKGPSIHETSKAFVFNYLQRLQAQISYFYQLLLRFSSSPEVFVRNFRRSEILGGDTSTPEGLNVSSPFPSADSGLEQTKKTRPAIREDLP